MELNNQNNYQEQHYQNDDYVNSGGLSLKVMTDEQMESLRKQISVYAILCEQLVDMHRSFSAQEYITSGVGMGSLYSDSMMTYGGVNKMTRHRWTPTPVQLQMLERMFKEGIGTPSKQKIKDLTAELSQHGPISESNVYNWFQNRRARSKRKQVAEASNHSDADVEPETDQLPAEKNTRPPDASNVQDYTPPAGAMNGYIQDPGSHCLGTQRSKGKSSFSSGHDMRSYGTYRQLAIYETAAPSNVL